MGKSYMVVGWTGSGKTCWWLNRCNSTQYQPLTIKQVIMNDFPKDCDALIIDYGQYGTLENWDYQMIHMAIFKTRELSADLIVVNQVLVGDPYIMGFDYIVYPTPNRNIPRIPNTVNWSFTVDNVTQDTFMSEQMIRYRYQDSLE